MDKNYKAWYVDEGVEKCTYRGVSRKYYGIDDRHDKFYDMRHDIGVMEYSTYHTTNSMALSFLLLSLNMTAYDCFATYVSTFGGNKKGIVDYGTRKFVNIDNILSGNIVSNAVGNSAKECFEENICKIQKATESVLDEYNTDIYIAVAPSANWYGCSYLDDFQVDNLVEARINFDAMAIFNVADAVATAHCTYNPQIKEYKIEYVYYLSDYYDFDKAKMLDQQNMLGLCRSYELYGKHQGEKTWKNE